MPGSISRASPAGPNTDVAAGYAVAIVGCGPVGALAANLLGAAGLRTIVIEQERELHPLPRAVHVDHEMMRLFQAAGVADEVARDMRETEGHLHIGADGGVIRYLGTTGRPRPFGWANDYFFFQPELEAHLRTGFARHASVELCLGARVESVSQDADGVSVSLSGAHERISARWLLGCDGSRSMVRKSLGIPLRDLEFEEPWLVVDAEVDGPLKFAALSGVPPHADLQKLSVMMCDPKRPATVVPGRGNHRRWEFMLVPGDVEQEMTRPERVAELIAPWVEGVGHRVVRAAIYRFHGLLAERWQEGRVFLAGDAAHQTPPFFGQGMCHGLRDVANLSWKIALVESGRAPPDLLSTYQQEREPHVRRVITAAVEAGRYICVLDPQAAAARDARIRSQPPAQSTAADLIPALSAGIVAIDTPGAGERFIQPRLRTPTGTRLLDEVTGSSWRLFVRDSAAAIRHRQDVATWVPYLAVDVVDVSELVDEGHLATWFATRSVQAALVRPDFYVFGTARGEGAVADLLRRLHASLSPGGVP